MTNFAQHATLLAALLPTSLARAVQQPNPSPQALHDACARLGEHLAWLVSFVPTPVLDRHLAQPHEARLAPAQLNGSILVAELLGLQALSMQLARADRQGGEEAGRIVNEVFTTLTATITAHGGGVITFGGDALTAFFDAARLGLSHAAHAAQAGLALQQALLPFEALPTSVGALGLRLRAVIHSGTMVVAEVGDDAQTEVIVTGSAVQRAVTALERSSAGDVLISQETLALIDESETAPGPGPGDFQRLLRSVTISLPPIITWQAEPPSPATLIALLDRIVALRSYAPQGGWANGTLDRDGAFRPAAALVADLSAFRKLLALIEFPALVERDLSLVGQVLEALYSPALHVVRRYSGSVNRIDMASSGNRMLALFGVPRALDDAAERAVQAALELRLSADAANEAVMLLLRDWVKRHPEQRQLLRVAGARVRQRLGVATGVMFAGVVGAPERRMYVAVGEAIGIAARLMDAAFEGEILLSSRVQRAAQHLVRVEPMASLPQGGDAPAVPAFRVLAPLPNEEITPQRATPLVGRQEELAQLQAAALRALRGGAEAGGVVAIVGDPGIGKSRLADELIDYQPDLPAELLVVREVCQSYEQTQAYACVRRVLRRLLALPPDADQETQVALVEQRLGELLPDELAAAPLLLELLGLPAPASELNTALQGEQRRTRLHDLVVQLVLAYAKRGPLLLAVDDLHWCDASSAELLGQLARSLGGSRLLLLVDYRPLPALDALWADVERVTAMRLTELAPFDSAALLRTLLDGEPPASVVELAARAQGVPFFLEETVNYLLASGALARDDNGAWVTTRPLDDKVPVEIEQLVVARLDRLNHEARALAEVASVLGTGYGALLPAVAEQPASFVAQLGELMAAGLVVTGPGADDGPHFKHELLRDVTYNSLVSTRRRALHARVADAIETAYAPSLDTHRVVLAQHRVLAEQHRLALPHLLAEAQAAQGRYAHKEALRLYEQAFVMLLADEGDEVGDRQVAAAIHEAMGDILALTGNYEAARFAYEQLLVSLALHSSPVRRASVERRIGSTYEHQGSYEQALHWLEQAEATAVAAPRNDGGLLERARIMSDKGWIYFRRGELAEAEDLLGMALALLDLHPNYEEQARVLNRIAGVAWQRGDLGLAQSYVERGLKVSQKSGDLVGQAKALNNLNILLESQGRVDEALRASRQAIEINERVGNKRELAFVTSNIGWIYYNCYSFDQAHQYFTEAVSYSQDTRDAFIQILALLGLGNTLAAVNQLTLAKQIILRSCAIASQLNLSQYLLEGYVALGEIALGQKDLETALAEYHRGLLLNINVDSEEVGRLQRLEARIALAQGDVQRAIALLKANEALFARLQNYPEAARTRKLLNEVIASQASSG